MYLGAEGVAGGDRGRLVRELRALRAVSGRTWVGVDARIVKVHVYMCVYVYVLCMCGSCVFACIRARVGVCECV